MPCPLKPKAVGANPAPRTSLTPRSPARTLPAKSRQPRGEQPTMQRRTRQLLCVMLVTVATCSGRAAEPITPVLLTTFPNPTPATDDRFGGPVAPMGTDRVLIGVIGDDLGATDSGVAHLLRTDGVLLTTFTNPTPSNARCPRARVRAPRGPCWHRAAPSPVRRSARSTCQSPSDHRATYSRCGCPLPA